MGTAPLVAPYVQAADYAAWGLPASFDPTLIQRATTIINNHCHRPLGLGPVQYSEQLKMPSGRNVVMLSYRPVIGLISCEGRYGYPRRSEMLDQIYPGAAMLLLSTELGGPPNWNDVPVSEIAVDTLGNTGEIWLPAGVLLYHYTDIRIVYQAGLQPDDPRMDQVRQACVNIAQAMANRQAIGGSGVRSARSGNRAAEFFSPSIIDADTKALLEPFRPKVLR